MQVYKTVEELKKQKATQVHQKMNGYRKKKKLDIPALQLEDVESWVA